jgi:hypothetical protein
VQRFRGTSLTLIPEPPFWTDCPLATTHWGEAHVKGRIWCPRLLLAPITEMFNLAQIEVRYVYTHVLTTLLAVA